MSIKAIEWITYNKDGRIYKTNIYQKLVAILSLYSYIIMKKGETIMDNKNITSVELNDETLDKVTGGTQTGDVKDNKVWINFPFPVNYMSGYKSCDDIISLANNFYGYKDSIIPNINDDVRLAVQNLFSLNNREMPTNVKEFLGM